MNPELFFENFDLLAESPNGIQKLREMILQMAVQGKLVEQNPDDEPAGVLLGKITAEKERLVKEKKIRKSQPLSAIEETEHLFEIPKTWKWVRLGNLGDWGAGATPNRKKMEYYDGSINWFKSGELNDGYITDSDEKINTLALKECSLRLNSPDDVLIAMYGATIGKVAILKTEGTTNQAVCACTCYDGYYNEYLFLLLKAYRKHFTNQGSGGAQPNISRQKIIHTVSPLPPLEEQKRIVTKVDQLMALCDQLESLKQKKNESRIQLNTSALNKMLDAGSPEEFAEHWQLVCENFDLLYDDLDNVEKLRQAILQLAVQGKLVEQDVSDEPAGVLLGKIKAEKERLVKEKVIRKSKPLPEIDDEDVPFKIPTNWEWTMLGTLCFSVADGPHFSPKYVTKEEGIPFLSARNVKLGGFELDSVKYVSPEDHKKFCERIKPDKGDILYTKGGTTGVALVNDLDFEFSVWVHLSVLQIARKYVDSYYLAYALNCPLCYEQSQKFTHGSSNRDLGLTRMVKILLPLPPLKEQKRIVAKVDQLMAICDQLEAKIKQAQSDSEKLVEVAVRDTLNV
ncbi:restriction endonuclease subunit S [Methanococcoides orientis]|uniref:restriction endonuclease subunit S n=1 Tax=Methanococcoides orientis TaxID=2822137 RepID=UPI001E40A3C2|nr:restriction endonuclease subunit S [Methanococcoides orientis]UGV41415.1 restriction endonuclease subunit S [Methanococcoides orientis]